jgi:hypothetical protein
MDSTVNSYTGTKTGSTATARAGKINGAIDYTGVTATGSYYTIPDVYQGINQSSFTWEVWFNPDTILSDDGLISRASSTCNPAIYIYGSMLADYSVFKIKSTLYYSLNGIAISSGTWNHLVITYTDNDDTIRYYFKGNQVETTSTGGGKALVNLSYWIGMYASTTHKYDGKMDETRFSDVQRNLSWINTSFLNQNNPYTFLSVGEQVSGLYNPDMPYYFEARTYNTVQINLNWSKGANADKTIIIYNTSDYPIFNYDTVIYNGTGLFFNHTGLSPNTHYFYRAYSWNNSFTGSYNPIPLRSHDTTMGYNYSEGYVSEYITVKNPNPANGRTIYNSNYIANNSNGIGLTLDINYTNFSSNSLSIEIKLYENGILINNEMTTTFSINCTKGLYFYDPMVSGNNYTWFINVTEIPSMKIIYSDSYNFSVGSVNESQWLWVSNLIMDNSQMFLLMFVSIWLVFFFKTIELRKKDNEIILSIFTFGMSIILGVMIGSYSYFNSIPFGFIFCFLVPISSIALMIDAFLR